ncbi:DNA-directed RNA polymerase subunit L [archaeon]|jgi:DNA-directed RNA polymerase subunit L|nr:DNA-directed RNA polymerase subunit L [archaeon]MBT6698409.1 DNA-directed RNA polymerase subunit L [archaeon]
MELNILEESKTKMVFELHGETHTFCNLLKEEIRKVKGVELVAYKIDHPLVGIPTFQLETKGVEPKKAIKEALKSVQKLASEFEKQAKKL